MFAGTTTRRSHITNNLLAGRKDVANLVTDEVLVESNTNMSIGCPGITRNTFVVQLEWRCTGRCGSKRAGKKASSTALVKYVKDQGTTVLKSKKRLKLDSDMFSLEFDPVTAADGGEYSCLVNSRPQPDAVIDLKVLGEWEFICLFERYYLYRIHIS